MRDPRDTLRSISSDLKALIQEEREKGSFLFSTLSSCERFGPVPLSPPPRPISAAAKPKPPKFSPPPPVKKQEPVAAPAAPKETAPTPSSFELEALAASSPASSFSDQGAIAKRMQKLFPAWKLLEHPPTDEEAVKIASAWKIRATSTEILVLYFSPHPSDRLFMHNFSTALHRSIAPAQLIDARSIERENLWEAVLNAPNLKEVYAPPLETWNAPHLLKHVKAIPATQENYLGKCRLYLLQEAEAYRNSPQLKRLLWQQIGSRK